MNKIKFGRRLPWVGSKKRTQDQVDKPLIHADITKPEKESRDAPLDEPSGRKEEHRETNGIESPSPNSSQAKAKAKNEEAVIERKSIQHDSQSVDDRSVATGRSSVSGRSRNFKRVGRTRDDEQSCRTLSRISRNQSRFSVTRDDVSTVYSASTGETSYQSIDDDDYEEDDDEDDDDDDEDDDSEIETMPLDSTIDALRALMGDIDDDSYPSIDFSSSESESESDSMDDSTSCESGSQASYASEDSLRRTLVTPKVSYFKEKLYDKEQSISGSKVEDDARDFKDKRITADFLESDRQENDLVPTSSDSGEILAERNDQRHSSTKSAVQQPPPTKKSAAVMNSGGLDNADIQQAGKGEESDGATNQIRSLPAKKEVPGEKKEMDALEKEMKQSGQDTKTQITPPPSEKDKIACTCIGSQSNKDQAGEETCNDAVEFSLSEYLLAVPTAALVGKGEKDHLYNALCSHGEEGLALVLPSQKEKEDSTLRDANLKPGHLPPKITKVAQKANDDSTLRDANLKPGHLPPKITKVAQKANDDSTLGDANLKPGNSPTKIGKVAQKANEDSTLGDANLKPGHSPPKITKVAQKGNEGDANLKPGHLPPKITKVAQKANEDSTLGDANLKPGHSPPKITKVAQKANEDSTLGDANLKPGHSPPKKSKVGQDRDKVGLYGWLKDYAGSQAEKSSRRKTKNVSSRSPGIATEPKEGMVGQVGNDNDRCHGDGGNGLTGEQNVLGDTSSGNSTGICNAVKAEEKPLQTMAEVIKGTTAKKGDNNKEHSIAKTYTHICMTALDGLEHVEGKGANQTATKIPQSRMDGDISSQTKDPKESDSKEAKKATQSQDCTGVLLGFCGWGAADESLEMNDDHSKAAVLSSTLETSKKDDAMEVNQNGLHKDRSTPIQSSLTIKDEVVSINQEITKKSSQVQEDCVGKQEHNLTILADKKCSDSMKKIGDQDKDAKSDAPDNPSRSAVVADKSKEELESGHVKVDSGSKSEPKKHKRVHPCNGNEKEDNSSSHETFLSSFFCNVFGCGEQLRPCCEHCQKPFFVNGTVVEDFIGDPRCGVKAQFHESCKAARDEIKKKKMKMIRQVALFGHLKRKYIRREKMLQKRRSLEGTKRKNRRNKFGGKPSIARSPKKKSFLNRMLHRGSSKRSSTHKSQVPTVDGNLHSNELMKDRADSRFLRRVSSQGGTTQSSGIRRSLSPTRQRRPDASGRLDQRNRSWGYRIRSGSPLRGRSQRQSSPTLRNGRQRSWTGMETRRTSPSRNDCERRQSPSPRRKVRFAGITSSSSRSSSRSQLQADPKCTRTQLKGVKPNRSVRTGERLPSRHRSPIHDPTQYGNEEQGNMGEYTIVQVHGLA